MNELRQLIEKSFPAQAGFVKARIFTELKDNLQKYQEINGKMELVENDIDKRINPFLIFDKAKTIIVVLFPYAYKSSSLHKATHVVSRSSYGKDYHLVLKEKLNLVSDYLKTHYGAKSKVLTDNHPLPERHLAYLAGLGNYGKNTLLINPKYGSFFFIGLILTDLELPSYDEPNFSDICKDCNLCLKACPTGAISETRFIEAKKCMSYLTQSKSEIPEEYLVKFTKYVYGCDICQIACIYNNREDYPVLEEFLLRGDEILTVQDLKDHTNKTFKKQYGDKAASFRGRNILLRNALLISANQKNLQDLEDFEKITNNNNEYLKQAINYVKARLEEGESK